MNWKTKISNKVFWVALIPAALLLVQTIAAAFGYTIDVAGLSQKLIAVVNAAFVLLAVLGIVVNPNTPGVTDKEGK
ncbi:phage holin [Loigolactobacillus bifermentans]|jgi:phi LC3 family holin|uniref:Holin n=1 Tax=Loigolactobacillus bifermentans DSM 20003 TaxID=1423726 RepID=A0A0R1H2Z1_9LACO|nr:phage holin [Loigolactobacillus bifermentans]KRK40783.1 hypothetical protein FC07_GL002532 [Loigolactobacillus bifermentans DSM 20003]QGG59535.1 phage holin [Loigolactobacillus bifermentans]